jgi:SAM-dependent methyltransferase
MPVSDASIDLVISSSVLEHVYDPEKAVAEMARTLKEDGYVYAEIPFMRAFHMAPIDYQRYTISGIEELFRRHGFELLSKGICSGPFTAWALFAKDFGSGLFSFNRYLRAGMALLLGIVFHPFKYLDRLCEKSKWAQVCACNFYYLGRKTRQRDRTV